MSSIGSQWNDERIRPCPDNGETCEGCERCDPMWLPEDAVQTCDIHGDPFVMYRIRPPVWAVDKLPKHFKNIHFNVRRDSALSVWREGVFLFMCVSTGGGEDYVSIFPMQVHFLFFSAGTCT